MEIIITIIVFAACLAAIGIGLLLKGRCLRGSCGGEPVRIGNMQLGCGNCPKREDNSCSTPTADATEHRGE